MAASKLFLSPQGLSKMIKSMEEEVGAPLFVRTKDGFVPTESGVVFYEMSKGISQNINEMFSAIEAVSSREKRFKVGFAAGTIRTLDIPSVNSFMKSNPEFMSTWDEQENEKVLNKVLSEEINCGLVVGKMEAPGLVSELIKEVDIVLYVYKDHRLWNQDSVSIMDIKDEPLISMNENYRIYHDVINACHMNGFNPDIIARVAEGVTIRSLVKNNVGIGIAPRFFQDEENLKAVTIKDAYTWDVYGIYLERSVDAQIAKKFIQEIKAKNITPILDTRE